MTDSHFADHATKVKEIFFAACEAPATERQQLVEQMCAGDVHVRAEVEALLAADDSTGCSTRFLETPVMGQVLKADGLPAPSSEAVPATIGEYRIVRRIGEGGMGVVFEATQDHPRRTVALKIIRAGIGGPRLLERFRREADLLGRLRHPGIAHIYAAGVAETESVAGHTASQPFFAMELVEGLPLNEYARQHGLETNQRLELIAQIGDAVQHAHERNVIHRDLKPANILVESSGQPKILDFGVARATDVDLQAVTLQTDVGQLVGTLPYMSPEQAAGDPARIGPGSDVYSLGVICYELLTGTLPYDTRGKSPIDATRIIREQEPLRLTSVHTRFRGDIETIVLNALEKDPARRYQTAAAMAEDIRRYLRHEPIQARQPSPAYRAVKFVRRHRILVSALVLAFAAILTGLGFATYGLVQARQERDRALQALALSEAVEGFFADMVNAASPRREGRDATLSNLLDKSAAELSAAKVDNAATRAVLQNAIGRTYLALHRLPEAETHLKKALDLAESSLGEHVKTMTIMHNLGEVYLELGQLDQAEALLDRSLALCRRLLGGDHQHAAHINNVLATVYSRSGRYEKAAVIYRMVLETQRQRLGPDHEQTVGAAFNLARLYVRTKKFELAEPMLQNLRETLTRLEGPASYGTLMSCDALGELYTFQKRYDEAEPNFRAAYDGFLDQLGPTNPQTNTAQQNLGFVCLELGRIDEANTILRSDAQRQRIRDGTSSEAIVSNLVYLGVRFKDAGRLQEAEAALEDAKSAATHLNPSGGIALAVIMLNLGKVRLELANYSEAEANLREALERFQNLPAKYQEKVEKVCQSLADLSARTGQPPPSDVCSLPEQDAKERDTSGS